MSGDPYVRAMFGENAVQVGFNYIVQEANDGRVLVIAQSTSPVAKHPLMFGSQRTHVMALGDMVFRPRLVMGSDKLRGRGLTGIATSGFLDMDAWGDSADLILDPTGQVANIRQKMERTR